MDAREIDQAIETATDHADRAERDLRDALDDGGDIKPERVTVAADDLHELAKEAVARAALLRARRHG